MGRGVRGMGRMVGERDGGRKMGGGDTKRMEGQNKCRLREISNVGKNQGKRRIHAVNKMDTCTISQSQKRKEKLETW